MTTWQDAIIAALNIGGICFIAWCLTRPSKKG